VRRAFAALLALAALPAAADEVRVISPRPDAVSITIYRDLFALVTETRTVDLPAGPVTLVFDGVVDTLIPQSAAVADAGRAIAESNYDFERLTPANILKKSIGKSVTLTRMNPATGRARQVAATLVAANNDGVVFATADGNEALHCSGLPEQLTFEELPGDLKGKPTLSIRLAAGAPGKREVRVSYIAHGFAWSANYVGNLDAAGERMNLHGWVTLGNLTGSSLRDAQVQVVAGRLNLLDAEEGRGTSLIGDTADYRTDESLDEARTQRLAELLEEKQEESEDEPDDVEYFSGCYPYGPPQPESPYGLMGMDPDSSAGRRREAASVVDSEELMEIIVTGSRESMAVRENLADYQMYRLPVNTDLNALQTKQVAFLHKLAVKVERFYSVRLASDEESLDDMEDVIPASVKIGWRNRAADGLGEPLPSGIVRFFEESAARAVFVGDGRIKDSPVDTPIELRIGSAIDVALTVDNPDAEPPLNPLMLLTRRAYLPLHLRASNAKSRPVIVEIRQGPIEELEDMRVKGASVAPQRKFGDYMWRLTVPANGEATLSYKVGGKMPSDD
jgi:hypothetical protein